MLITTDHGPIRELQLNRPPVNALTTELMRTLRHAIESAPQQGVRALILSGSPGKFSAGLDIPLLIGLDQPAIVTLWHELYALLKSLACSPIPIVAAITGHAPAGGTVLAVFCDRRIMAQGDFKIGLNEVQVAIPLPPVILAALRRQVGARCAEWLSVTGTLISPDQALQSGLVEELVPAENVVHRAIQWCQTLLALPAQAMSTTRRAARADLVALFARDLEDESRHIAAIWSTPEAQNTLRAVAQKLKKR
jgi:Delta3-Delta2-enoyl-CoA isomerase